ncbi:hypothetical protein [Saccharicrinis aurantiacus]|uniref:hypothetical protein n=1 Tax=Saccharicrinis aurantiacus TaxID=1849719 RepID=UPI002490B28E|nr:hypothetical protein [Saccharicrinis aurantiacus]
MKTGYSYTNQQFRFKQWSRNAYAAFASIGKEVSIGNLSISAAQWVGDALNQLSAVFEAILKLSVDDDTDELQDQELLELLPLTVAVDAECAINNKYKR